MGFTRRLAEFVTERASFDSLPAEVVARSKDMMLNAAAVGLAGAAQPEAHAVARFVQEMRGNGKCTIIGMGVRSSPVYAALTNGTMVHLLDFDDEIARRGVHPSSVVFPVVMALGEMNGYSGRDVLVAFALGCEIASKLGGADTLSETGYAPSLGQGWHRDGIAGTIGATAAAAYLLGLDREQLEGASGIASGEAAGLQANFATPARAFQCGRAAMNGIMAALLAQGGLTGSRHAIEDVGGLLASYGGEAIDEDAFFSHLGNPYDVIHPGVTLKLYPCDSASHTAIDAVLQLVQQYRIAPGQVEAVRVSVTPPALQSLPFFNPQTGWEARSSLNYVAAVALLYGQPLIEQFSDAAVRDVAVRAMMDRVSVDAAETPTRLALWPSTVCVTLSGGRELQHRAEFAHGQPELPLAPEELDAKFLYCSRYILPPDHIQGAIEQFRDLENIPDITGLASILGG